MTWDIVVACTMCFANADSPLLDAARLGVLVMAAVTSSVLVVLACWFKRLARLSDFAVETRDAKGAGRPQAGS